MSSPAVRSVTASPLRLAGEPLRVAFVGPRAWLDGCCPARPAHGLTPARYATGGAGEISHACLSDGENAPGALDRFHPHVSVIFDPPAISPEVLRTLPGVTLGVLVAGVPDGQAAAAVGGLDRLVSFDPALTGTRIGAGEIWRAIPPSVSDLLYREARPLHHAPRAISIGRSSAHREAMLMPAKHHHDLLQVIHGVSGAPLAELLGEYDVGVYVAPAAGGGFGQQVGVHLAAGQLLLSESLTPAHGLERNIDYLQVDSPDALVWTLDRLGRFPEMHRRIGVRGRLKAERYRASRLFGRLVHDLLADVAAFGTRGGESA